MILLQDLRYGVRMLRRGTGFTALSVFALGLGIGVNTAVFTAYRAAVARPLDARNPSEMVNIALKRDSGGTDFAFSYPDYEAYRDSVHSFAGLIAFSPGHMTLSHAGGARHAGFATAFVASENYFRVLGAAALRGRTFDSAPFVLISENYWQKRFAGDAGVLGKTIRLNGAAVMIGGIAPGDFVGTSVAAPDFWVPISLEPLLHADEHWLDDRENRRYRLFGRLAPGASMRQAQAEMNAVADRLRALRDPQSEAAKRATILIWPGSPFPLPLKTYSGLILTIVLILSAAGMVLVVACANVASLQLARTRSRRNELHTRMSLGASRLRVIRQLVTESALLGLVAGALALLFTWALLKVSVTLAAEAVPVEYGTFIFDVTPDLAIFGYVFAVSLVAGILFGLAPAIESSRTALSSSLRGGTAAIRSRRLQDLLISAQVALSLALLIAGGMLIRSSIHLLKAETGYDAEQVIDVDLQFPQTREYTASRKKVLVDELRTRLAALPGVTAITSARPPGDSSFRTAAVSVEGHNIQSMLHYTYVQANYFETLGIPLVLGHRFSTEAGQPMHSVILSESAARQLWPGENPAGRGVRLGPVDERAHHENELFAEGLAYQVVGVAKDTRGAEFDGSDSKQVYLALGEEQLAAHPLLVRTQSNPAEVKKRIDGLIASVDGDLVASASTLGEMLRRSPSLVVSSLAAATATLIGLLGLLLALMGIYGTVSYIVALRTREIGIRLAVGAQKRDILGLILRESAGPVAAGLPVGMVFAIGTCYPLRDVLYGHKIVDGAFFAGVAGLFMAIALLAAYPPSRRAMRIDPMDALRDE